MYIHSMLTHQIHFTGSFFVMFVYIRMYYSCEGMCLCVGIALCVGVYTHCNVHMNAI